MSLHRLCCCEEGEVPECCGVGVPASWGCTRNTTMTDAMRRVIYEWNFTRQSSYQVVGGAPATVISGSIGQSLTNSQWTALPTGWSLGTCEVGRTLDPFIYGDDFARGFNYGCPSGPVVVTDFGALSARYEAKLRWGQFFEIDFNGIDMVEVGLGLNFLLRAQKDASGTPIFSAADADILGIGAPLALGTEFVPSFVSADLCPLNMRVDVNATRSNQLTIGSCVIDRMHTITGFFRIQVTGLIDCQEA